jgi:hypothetical protein
MLSGNVLEAVYRLASVAAGDVIEVGAYVGGGTIALGSALCGTNRRVVTIEAGGVSNNPYMPSDDILGDLHRNLSAYGLDDLVTIVPGVFHKAVRHMPAALRERSVGLAMIDSDGFVHYQLGRLARWLRPDAHLVIDDYGYGVKGERMQAFLDEGVARGTLQAAGIVDGGTWFGRLCGEDGLAYLAEHRVFLPEEGRCWLLPVDVEGPCDTVDASSTSSLRLFEDDRELGPAHALHADIRATGGGGYSHWGDWVYLSTSDGTDPNTNGRRYEVDAGDGRRVPAGQAAG